MTSDAAISGNNRLKVDEQPGQFSRCNVFELRQDVVQAHGGEGLIRFARMATSESLSGACHFIDFTTMPVGTSIGEHTHAMDEEEFYLILSGSGRMRRDGEEFDVGPGDLIRNRPGGTHGLTNTGSLPLQLFVFEVQA